MEYTSGNDTFKIVEKIPYGYNIWNIGDNMGSDTLLPLCEEYGNHNVKTDTLKAVEIDKEDKKFLEKVSMHYGFSNMAKCEKYLKRKNADEAKKAVAEKAIAIFKKYMW